MANDIEVSGKGMDPPINKVSKCVEFFFENWKDSTNLYRILRKCGVSESFVILQWTDETRARFNALFSTMKKYQSTELIISEDHAQKIGSTEWPPQLEERIKKYKDFEFNKVFIVSDNLWDSKRKPKVWRWIEDRRHFIIKKREEDAECARLVTIDVAMEGAIVKAVREMKNVDSHDFRKFFDMGIYYDEQEEPFAGFLDRESQDDSGSLKYRWRFPPKKKASGLPADEEWKYNKADEVAKATSAFKFIRGKAIGQDEFRGKLWDI